MIDPTTPTVASVWALAGEVRWLLNRPRIEYLPILEQAGDVLDQFAAHLAQAHAPLQHDAGCEAELTSHCNVYHRGAHDGDSPEQSERLGRAVGGVRAGSGIPPWSPYCTRWADSMTTQRFTAEQMERAVTTLERILLGTVGQSVNINEIALMLRQATETERQQTWQPIATAPKDGTSFMGAVVDVNGGRSILAFWSQRQQQWLELGAKIPTLAFLTHWLPLPAPPQEAR